MSSLGEKLYLCLSDGIAEISAKGVRCAPFSDAVSICAGEYGLYCADKCGAIWHFDKVTMMERAIGSGGPGVCDMCLSDDGKRLFSLLGEADSILMSDACSIRPLAVNCCGCNPQNMSCCGNIIAVSGGESGCVHLFSADMLECITKIQMPGPVFSVLLGASALYALCMTAEMNTSFVICRGKEKRIFHLKGMPGCFYEMGDSILISTLGRQYLYSLKEGCVFGMSGVPGKPTRICFALGRRYLLDGLSETVFESEDGLFWKPHFMSVKSMYDCC